MDALLLILVISLLIILVVNNSKWNQARKRFLAEAQEMSALNSSLKTEVHQLKFFNQDLAKENEALAAFKDILDAKNEAERILREANAVADQIRLHASQLREKTEWEVKQLLGKANGEAQSEISKAQEEAKQIRSQSKSRLEEASRTVESIMASAHREAKSLMENARKRAEEIAGSAFEVVEDAERFERVAKAMKNLIDGYGDQYVVPSRSLLDELAEDYGFTEAGEELRNARDRSKQMVKSRTAATCDYVENNRRETAITFVVDAFNGKVDSILSRAKDANIGTLEQEIRDAFNLVNHNGSAFRSARILPEYRDARLTELRWAATAQEIKARDKEEQRRIKEAIREEEKAQRDFERAMREAAKEEELLRKAMEKIQAQVEKASAEQRTKYEAQLAEMAEKLREVEERNQRAMSMAQQTRVGNVYVISNVGSFGEDVFKIGMTRRLDPLDRVHELGNASVPFSFDVHAMISSDDAPVLERTLHQHFLTAQVNKVNARKEFFRVPIQTIRQEIEKLGISTRWTLTADAKQYRETLAIEKALRENPELGKQWLESQADFEPSMGALEEEEATT
jgi:hypothetical protein